jgi:hypothetical protein
MMHRLLWSPMTSAADDATDDGSDVAVTDGETVDAG